MRTRQDNPSALANVRDFVTMIPRRAWWSASIPLLLAVFAFVTDSRLVCGVVVVTLAIVATIGIIGLETINQYLVEILREWDRDA